MKLKFLVITVLTLIMFNCQTKSKVSENKDTVQAADGKEIEFNFLKHASVYFIYDGKVFYSDPVIYDGIDYSQLPKADVIFITHDHYDHLDTNALKQIVAPNTVFYANADAKKQLQYDHVIVMENGDMINVQLEDLNFDITAVPAYNTTPDRDQFHPKNRDNGYIVTIGGTSIYLPGDCENIPEMSEFPKIDIAFLPINQPYTMTVEQAVEAAEIIKPKILYPFHYGETDLKGLDILKTKGIDVRVFPM